MVINYVVVNYINRKTISRLSNYNFAGANFFWKFISCLNML